MVDRQDRDYQIGYGRPPKGSRFQPGQSGNPKGRPKASKNFGILANTELDQSVTVNENGKRRRITKREAMIKQLVNGAAKGNHRSMETLLKLNIDQGERETPHGPVLSEDDRETLAAFLERQQLNKGKKGDSDE